MNIAPYIDHTLLKSNATMYDIDELCAEALEYGVAAICVNPYWVHHCAKSLTNSDVKVCTVVGFPLGANEPEIKAREAKLAVQHGADEIDMVINIGKLVMHNPGPVLDDVIRVRESIPNSILKVIIETCLLTDEQKITACHIAQAAGADFVKTSTGFSTGGATIEDIKLMRQTVGDNMLIKASGGIKNLETALAMIAAGANRLGVSAGIAIIEEQKQLAL